MLSFSCSTATSVVPLLPPQHYRCCLCSTSNHQYRWCCQLQQQVTQIAPLSLSGGLVGGWLWQQADNKGPDDITFTPVSETQPTEQQLADLAFAWRCVKHVKSNAITIAKEQRLLGMGSGQPNRVKSVQIALEKAAEDVQVCV